MIKKSFAVVALAMSVTTMWGAGAAWAAQPAVRGCVGSSVSAAAHQPGPFGQFVSGLARDPESPPGVSDNVHTLASGGYSDDEFINTCN
jgi:hypothetical protein